MRHVGALVLIGAAFVAGLARGQDGNSSTRRGLSDDLLQKLEGVRREIKVIDLDDAIKRVPDIVRRENDHYALIVRMKEAQDAGKDITAMLEQGLKMKKATLDDLNRILKLHNSKYRGISEQEVWDRLINARFSNVNYEDEWLVNILDDLEEACKINIEIDARIYKFDTVTFDFERTSARAMLQMMGDALLFKWMVRGDTLYVYKERHEVLFGGEWLRKKKAAFHARKKALEEAMKEAEKGGAKEGGK
jgi:hypothetical protein